MTDYLVQKLVKARKNIHFELKKLYIKKFQLGFSSKIEMPQLNSARLGTFIAWLGSAREIPA